MKSRARLVLLLLLLSVSMPGCSLPGTEFAGVKVSEAFPDPQVAKLAVAAAIGDVNTIDQLVTNGVNVNAVGIDGILPLVWAMSEGKIEGVKRLLEQGADPNQQMEGGAAPIYIAASGDEPAYLKLMLEHDGDPNYVHKMRNETLLFTAIMCPKIIDVLIKYGANIDYQEYHGETPLMVAVGSNQYHSAYILLQAGADYTLENNWGYTLVRSIDTNNITTSSEGYHWRQKVIAFLRERGVQVNPPIQ